MSTPAAAIGGATPFGWATLGASLLGGAARPAGPSSADALFGSGFMSNDSSGWMINFGDGSNPTLDNGNRGGPTMTPVQTQAPGGYAAPIAAPNNPQGAALGTVANLPWMWIFGGAALLIVLWKKA